MKIFLHTILALTVWVLFSHSHLLCIENNTLQDYYDRLFDEAKNALNGTGEPGNSPNYDKARKIYTEILQTGQEYPYTISQKDYFAAAFHYAELAFENRGTEKPNYPEALRMFEELSHLPQFTQPQYYEQWLLTHFYLARLYDPLFNSGTPKDAKLATYFYLQVVTHYVPENLTMDGLHACYHLAQLAQKKDPMLLGGGVYDIIQLYKKIIREVQSNNAFMKINSLYNLAVLYSSEFPENNFKPDYHEAARYYHAIITNPLAGQFSPKTLNRARINYAGMLVRGEGQPDNKPNFPKALELYQKALLEPKDNFFKGDRARAEVGVKLLNKRLSQ